MAQYDIDQIVYIRSNNTSDTYNIIDSDARTSINDLSTDVETIQSNLLSIIAGFPSDNLNPAQTSDSENNNNLLYLTGAEIQSTSVQTYSNKNVYTQNGVLYSKSSILGNNKIILPEELLEELEEEGQEEEQEEPIIEYLSGAVVTWLDIVNTIDNNTNNNTIPTSLSVKNYVNTQLGNSSNWQNGIATGSIRMINSAQLSDNQQNPYALGENAVAEGNQTAAAGYQSHALGLGTIANYASQHVFGSYNIADSVQNTAASQQGTYIEIVGNGTVNNRSNARTLDWNGNETLAGKLTLGADGTTQYDAPSIGQVLDSLHVEVVTLSGINYLNIFLDVLSSELQQQQQGGQ